MLIKIIHFLTLTDTDELSKCSRYDHNLVYASSFRQVISFVFSFSVFLYGSLMFLPFEQALLMSLLIALTLFTIDQAIIGSEWALKVDFFHKPWLNYFASIVFLPIRLIPRILFSVAIAFVIATIAEISLQHKAIDEVLRQEMRVLNEEYFTRVHRKEGMLEESVNTQTQDIAVLNKRIKDKQAVLINFNTDMSAKDENSLVKQLKSSSSDYSTKKKVLDENMHQLQLLGVKIAEKQQLIAHWKNEKALELTTDRGAKKGARWHHANRQIILIGLEIGALQAKVATLKLFQPIYNEQSKSSLVKRDKLRAIKLSMGGDSLQALILQRDVKKNELMKNKALIKQDMTMFKQSLKQDGLFFEIKNGPLGRYIGLNKLYNDPDYGEAAKEFSYGLKLVVILVELSPVIVMVFFSPYSFYAEHMRGKKHSLENSIPTSKLKAEVEESEKQSSLLQKEKDKVREDRLEEMLDKKFDQALDDEYKIA